MNAALVPLARIRTMSNADLITTARKFDRLSVLEGELIKRLETFVTEEARKVERDAKLLRRDAQINPEVRKIVDWAKERAEA